MDNPAHWFLMKSEDGLVFGPTTLDQLCLWATDAQISPLDKVSTDEINWVKAPMVPELQMDYLIEVEPDQYYGPTTMGAVREFLLMNEISADVLVTNCRDGRVERIREIAELQPPGEEEQPFRISIRKSLQQRIRQLEEALLEERRALETAETVIQRLELRVAELTGGVPEE